MLIRKSGSVLMGSIGHPASLDSRSVNQMVIIRHCFKKGMHMLVYLAMSEGAVCLQNSEPSAPFQQMEESL